MVLGSVFVGVEGSLASFDPGDSIEVVLLALLEVFERGEQRAEDFHLSEELIRSVLAVVGVVAGVFEIPHPVWDAPDVHLLDLAEDEHR